MSTVSLSLPALRRESTEELVIGFYGNLAEWVDYPLIEALAGARPDWRFRIAGPAHVDVSVLERFENIELPGRIEYSELPAFCSGLDVAIIPYDMDNSRMVSVNPVKAFELLAAGVPVVSSDVPSVRGRSPYLRIASTTEEWLSAIEASLVGIDRAVISRSVVGEDWSSRLQHMRGIIREVPT